MTNPAFPCKNHPQKLSARRCFYCRDYICTDCQLPAMHHIFCSNWCILRHIGSEYIIKIIRRIEFLYLLLLVLILQTVLYFSLRNLLLRNEIPAAGTAADIRQQLSAFSSDTAFSSRSNTLQISGSAPANTIISLWHNGNFVKSLVSHEQHYEFRDQSIYPGANKFVLWALSDQGRVYKIDSIFLNYFSAGQALLAMPVEKFMTGQNYLALTFDAGSAARGADSILQILESRGVKCTFFLTGDFIRNYPVLVERLAGLGHELANHTCNHPHLTNWESEGRQTLDANVDRAFIQRQLFMTDSLFYNLCKRHLQPFWRAPYGEYNSTLLQWAAQSGYRHIGWTAECDSRDWVADPHSDLYRDPEQLYRHWMELEQAGKLRGAIILLHLGTERKSDFIYQVLARFIDQLHEKNYKLLTISQFFEVTNPL